MTMLSRRDFTLSTAALLTACAAPSDTEPQAAADGDAPAVPSGPLYFDLHIDTPLRMVSEGIGLGESLPYTHVDIPRMRQGGLHAGFFAVSTAARSQTPESAVRNALRITDVIVEEVEALSQLTCFLATTLGRRALRGSAGRQDRRILLGVEGGHMIDSSLGGAAAALPARSAVSGPDP